jgi:putative intracellular protease/amidase/YHS domain-containing protein
MKPTHTTWLGLAGALVLISTPLGESGKPAQPTPKQNASLKGLDPVVLTQGKELPGDRSISLTHDGHTYLFANAANRERFQKHPELYEIQFRGQCATMPGATGNPDLFAVYKQRIYIFGTENCREIFLDAPADILQPRKNVALLVFDGMELLDFAGPAEVFTAAGKGRAFNVFTVAASPGPVTSQGHVQVKPRYTLADCPQPDVIVIPGGNVRGPVNDPAIIDWVRKSSKSAEITMSVCNGAFVLAKADLLDGLEATTHWSAVERLRQTAPKTKVHNDRRFVDNGKIITAAGVSAGIDSALHVVARLTSNEIASDTARYMEYAWKPSPQTK